MRETSFFENRFFQSVSYSVNDGGKTRNYLRNRNPLRTSVFPLDEIAQPLPPKRRQRLSGPGGGRGGPPPPPPAGAGADAGAGGMHGRGRGAVRRVALGVCCPARCPRRLPSGVPSSASAVRRVALGVCRPARCPCVCRTACRTRRLPSGASSAPPGAYAPGLVSASVRKAVQAASLLRSSASCMTA